MLWKNILDMLSEEKHQTVPTVPTSRDSVSLKNFPATLYGRVVLARSFVTCETRNFQFGTNQFGYY